jgi:hypothetical protein
LTYFLIHITPAWGLALLFTTLIYFVPLVYISNKELIDHHLENASNIVSEQTQQVRDLAAQHTNRALEVSQSTFKDYSAKAQEALGQARGKAGEYAQKAQEAAGQAQQKAGEYGVKAQDAAVDTKQAAVDKGLVSQETADHAHEQVAAGAAKTQEQLSSLPSAPAREPVGPTETQAEHAQAMPVPAQ